LVLQRLRNGDGYPGVVNNDPNVFAEARKNRLGVLTFDVVLPDTAFKVFEQSLSKERTKSQFTFGFPDGDGECNCATWLERLALPLISGSMDDFTSTTASSYYSSHRFGQCI
jgi:hypothetical protein